MQLFPAIDLRDGKVVRLTQGDYDRMTVYGEAPCAQARKILGSVAVTDFDFTARMLKRYGDRIAVGVDAKDGYVAIHGWKEVSTEQGVDFCKRLAEAGCRAIIYTDIACDGAMQGTNLALYRQLQAEVPGVAFTASGGISSEAELEELDRMGVAAAILGKSLYTGALDLKRCAARVQR